MRFELALAALPAITSALAYNPFKVPGFIPTRIQKRADTWGGAVSLGPSKSVITKAVTTITPGTAPSSQNGELFLWPGMSNGTGDLVQTTLESWPSNDWCGAKTGEWCIRCSLFGSFGQYDGPSAPVSGDMKVEILYELLSDGETWNQTATNVDTGAVLSTFSYKSGGYMRGYGTGTECDDSCTATIAAQTYENTVITLKEADSTFAGTISTSQGATYEGLTVSGNVLTIKTINIPAMS